MAVLVFLGVCLGAAALEKDDKFDSITAKRFILMNHAGTKVRGVMTTSDRGEPLLKLLDESGEKTLLQLIVRIGDSPSVTLFDQKEREQVMLIHSREGKDEMPISGIQIANLKPDHAPTTLLVAGALRC